MEKKKNKFEEFKKNPKLKAILFFSFYFVFFLIIILSLRFGDRHNIYSTEYEKGEVKNFKIDGIASKNFMFNYTINIDGVKHEYYGEKINDDEYFGYNDITYYKKNGLYYVKNGEEWVQCENPFVFSELLDIDSIMTLLDSSFFDSKTTYNSGKINYNFLITTNTINKVTYKLDTDIADEPNQIILVSNEDKIINEIDLNLNDFCFSNNLCKRNLKIELNFDKFGESKPIDDLIKNN